MREAMSRNAAHVGRGVPGGRRSSVTCALREIRIVRSLSKLQRGKSVNVTPSECRANCYPAPCQTAYLQSGNPIASVGRFCGLELTAVELEPVPDKFDDDEPLVPLPVEPMLPVVLPLFRPDVPCCCLCCCWTPCCCPTDWIGRGPDW
jgi:hypothetical protein